MNILTLSQWNLVKENTDRKVSSRLFYPFIFWLQAIRSWDFSAFVGIAPGYGNNPSFGETGFMVRSSISCLSTWLSQRWLRRKERRRRRQHGGQKSNGERKSLETDLCPWPSFPFSLSLSHPMFLHLFFSAVLPETLCVQGWPDPRQRSSVTPGWVIQRTHQWRCRSVAWGHLVVNIRSDFGQHQWYYRRPKAEKYFCSLGIFHQKRQKSFVV